MTGPSEGGDAPPFAEPPENRGRPEVALLVGAPDNHPAPSASCRRHLRYLFADSSRLLRLIGSGIGAARLSPGDTGLQLLENAVATAAGLFTFILMFGPISGAHFNPVVSLVDSALGGLRRRDLLAYLPSQVAG
jgi:hypothetical protein